jgi:hypothetical protein
MAHAAADIVGKLLEKKILLLLAFVVELEKCIDFARSQI